VLGLTREFLPISVDFVIFFISFLFLDLEQYKNRFLSMDIPIAANVLGTFGAVCWSIQAGFFSLVITSSLTQTQLIPQIIINYRRHHTIGLQQSMMLLWACAGVPLGAYNIASGFNIALQVQPQILSVLSLITWGQCFYYGEVRSKLSMGILVRRSCMDTLY
jgi:hypothetical protein